MLMLVMGTDPVCWTNISPLGVRDLSWRFLRKLDDSRTASASDQVRWRETGMCQMHEHRPQMWRLPQRPSRGWRSAAGRRPTKHGLSTRRHSVAAWFRERAGASVLLFLLQPDHCPPVGVLCRRILEPMGAAGFPPRTGHPPRRDCVGFHPWAVRQRGRLRASLQPGHHARRLRLGAV